MKQTFFIAFPQATIASNVSSEVSGILFQVDVVQYGHTIN